MLKDISDWEHIGHGDNSTLVKEELKSPDGLKYLIKYPRTSELGQYWEDIVELIAAEIGTIFGLEMMKVEIVTRDGNRGCLLRNFVDEYNVKMHVEGGELLSSFADGYDELQTSQLRNNELIDEGFKMLIQLEHWNMIKDSFIDMLTFDVLIGNQDRHPFNWKMLYYDSGYEFSPIYDNGASLGFHFNDDQLMNICKDPVKLNRYVKKTKVKAGLYEGKSVKAKDLLVYLQKKFPSEFKNSLNKLIAFDIGRYEEVIHSLDLVSDAQREWLLIIIPNRREKILSWIEREEDNHE